jgi:hypothetical protein
MSGLLFASAMVVGLTACSGFPFGRADTRPEARALLCTRDGTLRNASPGRTELELRNVRYTGDTLEGTLLIGAVGGSLCLDKRLISGWDVTVEGVWECDSEIRAPVGSMNIHPFQRPSSEGHLLILEPGYWYGAPIRVPLFMTEQPTGRRNPDCVEVDLSLMTLGDRTAGSVRVLARRDPPSSSDGGVPLDGGVPPEPESSPDDVNPGRVWVPFKDNP